MHFKNGMLHNKHAKGFQNSHEMKIMRHKHVSFHFRPYVVYGLFPECLRAEF